MKGPWHWLVTPKPWVPLPRCPICHTVVTYPPQHFLGDHRWPGPAGLSSEREVRIAYCPVHGSQKARLLRRRRRYRI